MIGLFRAKGVKVNDKRSADKNGGQNDANQKG